MGLNITQIIPKKDISLDDLRNKKLAVDASQMLYQFLSSIRQPDGTHLMDSNDRITSHLMGISTRIPNLIERGLKLAFVFDGKPPSLKIHEKEQREHRKRLAESRLEKAKEEGDEELMLKYSKQTVRLSFEMSDEAKELIQAFGLPVIQAPSEAEAQCSFMAEKEDVYAVASSDYDSLLYSAPRIVRNLTLSNKRKIRNTYVNVNPELIELKQVLKELDIKQDQLIVLAILIGTDYNVGGIKGIGPKSALKLVKENRNFDRLFDELKPDFDWKKIYATFKSMPIMKNYQLRWSNIDEEKIRKILVDRHDFSEERVNKMLEKLTKKEKSQKGLSSFFKP
ncbi:flap endonuclease-1 [Candidatus Woesearchaeota archaeon]|nr:flap endonuclease-1 [Candidatus Woesearchaeota archaeon]